MSIVREPRDRIDYGYVINFQLDRIAKARSELYQKTSGTVFQDVIKSNALKYLAHVEALYSILLPEIRGEAEKYLAAARELYTIRSRLERDEFRGRRRELTEKIKEVYVRLPEDVARRLEKKIFLYEDVVLLADKALEILLTRLNEAGLLLSGRRIMIGVAGKG